MDILQSQGFRKYDFLLIFIRLLPMMWMENKQSNVDEWIWKLLFCIYRGSVVESFKRFTIANAILNPFSLGLILNFKGIITPRCMLLTTLLNKPVKLRTACLIITRKQITQNKESLHILFHDGFPVLIGIHNNSFQRTATNHPPFVFFLHHLLMNTLQLRSLELKSRNIRHRKFLHRSSLSTHLNGL